MQLFGQQRPLTGTLPLAQRRAADGVDGELAHHAQFSHCVVIEHWLLVSLETLIRIIPSNHRQGVPVARTGALILDLTVIEDL
ncbi:hypothetical protein D3C84_932760 [compost metagenome]